MSQSAHLSLVPNTQQSLANQLVSCLGHDGAVHVCQLNGWDGILRILRHQDDSEPDRH